MGSGVNVASAPVQGQGDDKLVVAVRRGDDRAFETLYARYHRPIASYVQTMVKDHGRAEDVTQEVFVSALRGMRATDRPIAFAPWIHGIAKNACIDEYRRSQRAREVSFDVDEAGGLIGSAPTPDAALFAKQKLDHLCGAFGGLSDTYHQVLLLRELEGLSYGEIGERMGMSRTAVEGSLFRARRRLAEEYDELATGARCQRIQGIIATATEARLGTRKSHQLARHVAHCQPCRREALAAGIDPSILTHVPLRRRAADKVAALLPFPGLARFLRGRGGGNEAAASLAGSPGGGLAAQASMFSEQLHAGWTKVAAIVALLVAGAGATGVGTKVAADRGDASAPQSRPTSERSQAGGESHPAGSAGGGAGQVAAPSRGRESSDRGSGRPSDHTKLLEREARGGEGTGGGRKGAGQPAPSDSRSGSGETSSDGGQAANDAGDGGDGGGGAGGGTSRNAPSTDPPAENGSQPLEPVVNGVRNTVGGTGNGVNQTVRGATQGLNQAVEGVNQTLQGSPQGLDDTVQGVNQTVQGATGGLGETVQGATQGVNETLEGVAGLLRPLR